MPELLAVATSQPQQRASKSHEVEMRGRGRAGEARRSPCSHGVPGLSQPIPSCRQRSANQCIGETDQPSMHMYVSRDLLCLYVHTCQCVNAGYVHTESYACRLYNGRQQFARQRARTKQGDERQERDSSTAVRSVFSRASLETLTAHHSGKSGGRFVRTKRTMPRELPPVVVLQSAPVAGKLKNVSLRCLYYSHEVGPAGFRFFFFAVLCACLLALTKMTWRGMNSLRVPGSERQVGQAIPSCAKRLEISDELRPSFLKHL
jgi:hypothetical protein